MVHIVEANGAHIPAIGFGTLAIGDACAEMVKAAIDIGYTHIDTAWKYGNEVQVGEGIAASGVARDKLFVTTKVSHEYVNDGALQTSAEESLANLRLDYVDLLLIHWPNPQVPLSESIPALVETRERGLARHIGVANFMPAMLDEAMALSDNSLVCNQIEYHPYLQQKTVRAAIFRHGMALTGYCPLARGRIPADPLFGEIAAGKGRTPAQIALRWAVQQRGVVPLPKASSVERVRENFAIFDFSLSDDEMAALNALDNPATGRVVNPPHAPKWADAA